MSRRVRFALSLLVAVPATAFAFDSVDLIPYTTSGAFPAYPGDPLRPLSGFLEIGVEHDSNPFRLSDSLSPASDNVLRYGGGARYQGRVIGRQSILLEGRGDYYDYQKSDALDHFAYSLLGEWQWELGNQLSGAVGAGRVYRIADPAQIQREIRQDVTIDRAYADGGWLFATNWRLRAGVAADRSTRQRPGAAEVRADSQTARVGLDYVTPLANTFGIEARASKGDAPVSDTFDPNGEFTANDYREKEISAVVSYGATSQFRVGGRVGHTERTFTEVTGHDFSGTTWRALVEWLPGNKTILGFESYKYPTSIIDVDAAYVVRQGSAFTLSWAPLAKLVFSGRLFEERRQSIGTPEAILLGTPQRDDTAHGARVGVGWEPVRFCEVGFGVEAGKRTSTVVLRDYDYTTVSANLRIRF
ncbi:MAG TPA: hypothetical protein VGO02_12290 [Burkholderiales bacterium]|nr:hypothetical protein [Burkholderiales bacterium]